MYKSLNIFLTCFFFLLLSHFSYASLINSDFSNGLNNWTTVGDVSTINEEAILGDNNSTYSLLYQWTLLTQANYTLSFDFSNLMSSYIPASQPFAFPDTFSASLYFINDISKFDITSGTLVFDAAQSLFDLDRGGVFNNSGTIHPSLMGSGWDLFVINFQNSYNYGIVAFELFDMNLNNNDSHVFLDNINIQSVPVPEPAALLLLLGSLFLGLWCIRKKFCIE